MFDIFFMKGKCVRSLVSYSIYVGLLTLLTLMILLTAHRIPCIVMLNLAM